MDIFVSNKNYNNCCRTCLNDASNEMHNIFEYGTENANVAEMLSSYTSLRVNMDDQLPKKLCSNCYYCLLGFHRFIVIALKADKKLKDYFTHVKPMEQNEISDWDDVDNESPRQSESLIKSEFDSNSENSCSIIENNVSNTSRNIAPKESLNLRCEVCNKRFQKLLNYKHHVKMHTKEYICNTCEEIFQDNHSCTQHFVEHKKDPEENLQQSDVSGNNNQNLVCEICSFSFKSIQSLSGHQKAHIPRNRVLQCTLCNKIFKKISHLKRHELTHNDNHLFKCNLCPKSYATEDKLKAHLNRHKGIKNHHCPICTKMFAHVQSLTNHIKNHTREKPYLCPTCGKMFDTSTNLNQHMKRHAGVKLFACNLCPGKFISKGELKSHSLTHTGERPFACDLCNGAFTKRSYLEKHKITHAGLKPYKCDVCSMKFADKNHLKRHYRIHTGEKPFRCDFCDRAFTQSNDLVKHKRIHLGTNVYKCDDCHQTFRLKTELRQHISEHFISSQLQSKVHSNIEQGSNSVGTCNLDVRTQMCNL